MEKTLFVVDDSDFFLSQVSGALKDKYNVVTMSSCQKMLSLLKKITPHLILLDIEMPEINGFDTLAQLKANENYAHIPVIFLTGARDVHIESKGFEMGVVDFIKKPFTPSVLINRVKLHITVSELIRKQTAQLKHTNKQLERSHKNMVLVLASAVESRDHCTGGHIERTTQYVSVMIHEMIKRGVYADELTKWDLEKVLISSLLHDVGKLGVSDIVLNKPDQLTPEEVESVKSHTSKGERLISKVISLAEEDEDDAFLHNARLFAAYHHENWDGTGYPHGLKGEEIPLHGRILSIVDVYDALITERPYKKAFTHERATEIIMEDVGKRYDPQIAEVFFAVQDQFKTEVV
ncbi:MAG: response regulator [Oscillospiraceae bacterium]|nr:response regulator [Oscillospiraceae bacterium]